MKFEVCGILHASIYNGEVNCPPHGRLTEPLRRAASATSVGVAKIFHRGLVETKIEARSKEYHGEMDFRLSSSWLKRSGRREALGLAPSWKVTEVESWLFQGVHQPCSLPRQKEASLDRGEVAIWLT